MTQAGFLLWRLGGEDQRMIPPEPYLAMNPETLNIQHPTFIAMQRAQRMGRDGDGGRRSGGELRTQCRMKFGDTAD